MKSTMVITVDNSVQREDVDGHEFFTPWRRRRSGVRRARRGSERGRFWRGGWTRRAPGGLQTRVEGAGGARGEGSVVGVLNQLGGIPPSSWEARDEEDDRGGAAGPPGGPRPGRQVGF